MERKNFKFSSEYDQIRAQYPHARWAKWPNSCCGGECIALYDPASKQILMQADDCYGFRTMADGLMTLPPESEPSSEEEFWAKFLEE